MLAGLEKPLTELLACYWNEIAKGASNPVHAHFCICQRQAVGGFYIHRKDWAWLRFWSSLISLLYGRNVVISHCSTGPGKSGVGSTQRPKTLKPPEKNGFFLKKKKKVTTFIQQPNLQSLLFFDVSCKTGNKYTQGQSIKGKKINCMRTIGEVYVASPLLLLDTNCLLITALFALHGGDSTESQLLPQTQMQVPVQTFQRWEGASNKPSPEPNYIIVSKDLCYKPKTRLDLRPVYQSE